MKSKNDILKTLALQAKNRLKSRTYEDSQTIKSDIRKSFKIYEGGLKNNYKLILINNEEDEQFYSKVKSLLSQNADIINPIGALLDKEKYASLNSQERDSYLFKLIEKYREMKKRFEKENLLETM